MSEQVQIFTTADPVNGVWDWGWQCFACCEEEDGGYGNASTAREAADNHAALCLEGGQ